MRVDGNGMGQPFTLYAGDQKMREGFKSIISGWMLIDGFHHLTDILNELAPWVENNKPLLPDEEKTLKFMIESQIARGFEEGIL